MQFRKGFKWFGKVYPDLDGEVVCRVCGETGKRYSPTQKTCELESCKDKFRLDLNKKVPIYDHTK